MPDFTHYVFTNIRYFCVMVPRYVTTCITVVSRKLTFPENNMLVLFDQYFEWVLHKNFQPILSSCITQYIMVENEERLSCLAYSSKKIEKVYTRF